MSFQDTNKRKSYHGETILLNFKWMILAKKRVLVWTCSFKDTSDGKTCSQMIWIGHSKNNSFLASPTLLLLSCLYLLSQNWELPNNGQKTAFLQGSGVCETTPEACHIWGVWQLWSVFMDYMMFFFNWYMRVCGAEVSKAKQFSLIFEKNNINVMEYLLVM